MIKYRHHRGSLEESMKTAQTFKTIDEMKQYICKDLDPEGRHWITPDDIMIGDVLGDDDRVGWKSVRYVLTKRYICEDYIYPQCIGLCSIIE